MYKFILLLSLFFVVVQCRLFTSRYINDFYGNQISLPSHIRPLIRPLVRPNFNLNVPHWSPVLQYNPKKRLIVPVKVKPEQPPSSGTAPLDPLVISEFRNQDSHGRYNFGYNGETSSRYESKDIDGTVRGSYSYIDSNGELQSQNYIADQYGFRVSGTNLPVGPGRKKRSVGVFPASTRPLFRHRQTYRDYRPIQRYSYLVPRFNQHQTVYYW